MSILSSKTFYFPSKLPTICTIFVEFLFAIPFPIAFPPTVSDATIALIMNCKSKFKLNFSVIFIVISAAIEPLSTPQMSPITSAQMLDTFDEFLISFIDVFAPCIFLLAFACISSSFATVTATPIISNIIPTNIVNIKINIAGNNSKYEIAFVDI